jgi:RimJ/RimL family protein N-acetyltransferase
MERILETERLILRQFNPGDAGFIVELVNTRGWIEFIGERNIKTEEAAVGYLENGPMKSYRENGFGLSMVEIKETSTPIGMCGLLRRDSLGDPEIGFAFLPEFMGLGYAFEIASSTMTYAKDQLQLKTILAITVPANKKSIRLLEKIGLIFCKTIFTPITNEELMLFSTLEHP